MWKQLSCSSQQKTAKPDNNGRWLGVRLYNFPEPVHLLREGTTSPEGLSFKRNTLLVTSR